jgi:hypothetical protein
MTRGAGLAERSPLPVPTDSYADFLETKQQRGADSGFAPVWMPDALFPFQRSLVEWAIRKGRCALFADCGLGKTLMQLVWAENVVRQTNGRVLVLTPLAVGPQTVAEGWKFGIDCARSRDGALPSARIVVTNYEKLHLFSPTDFVGVVCDESSILKHFSGATQKGVTRFLTKVPYRLLCTATAAPNDYIELGTSSEALGLLGYSDMLARFFKQSDNKPHRMEQIKQEKKERLANHFGKLSFRVSQSIGQWRLKGHAEQAFWQWVASWARACRTPADMGFPADGFALPPLIEQDHIIMPDRPANGMLFTLPACGLNEEREERRRTLAQRCDYVARLVDHDQPSVIWCHFNTEGDRLEAVIPGARQIAGSTADDDKEAIYAAFASGHLKKLIIKPKIGAWGLNWQFCNHVVTFASHSYEQYYQSVRRCWRFGQTRPVTVDIIATEGEKHVRENMSRKAAQADEMFTRLVRHMHEGQHIARATRITEPERLPSWLCSTNS